MRIRNQLLLGSAIALITAPAFAATQDPPAPPPGTSGPTAEESIAQQADQSLAQTSGQDIIVTATKRATTVQDVPFSVNAQTEEDIQRANANTIEDLSRNVAGLAVQNLGPGQSQVSVRGVSAGQIVRDQPGVKEQVGMYLDESVVSLSLFTPDFDLFDLNRVETLRGPQGTLFGSGSVGGTIRYITNQPELGITSGMVEANINTVEESDLGYHLKGTVNVPLGNTAALRAVAYGTHYGGFIDAIGPAGGKNVNDGSRVGGRLSILWEPAPNIRFTPRIVYQKVKADGFNREEVFNLYSNPFTVPPYTYGERQQFLMMREEFSDETWLADLVASADIGPVELTSVTSYMNRDILVSRDASALTHSVSRDLGFPQEVALIPSNLRDTTDLKQFTQEVRVSSTGDGPFQWLIGAFYSDVDRFYRQRLPTPGYSEYVDAAFGEGTSEAVSNGFPDLDSPYNSDLPYDIEQKAIFGEASYDFGQFKITGGARFYDFNEKRSFISGGLFSDISTLIDEKTSSDGISPRIIGTWEPNRNLSVNIQAAKGFRLGGVNDPLNLPLCSDEDEQIFGPFAGAFKDETLWNYEAGVKYSKGFVTFNGAVYHTRIKDLQVTLDAGTCSSRLIFNVPKAHTTGLELELAAQPTPEFDVSFAASFVQAEFDSTLARNPNDPNDPLTVATGIREGNRLPSVPKVQLAATATYTKHWGANRQWFITASAQHIGSRYTQPADQERNPRTFVHNLNPYFGNAPGSSTTLDLKLPSYQLVNLSGGIDWGNGLETVLYVNNLFDENAMLAFDRERGGRARLGWHVNQPRTIGITVRQKFGQ